MRVALIIGASRGIGANELLPKAINMAGDMHACVPQALAQHKPLIDEGFRKPYDESLHWIEISDDRFRHYIPMTTTF